MTLSRPLLDASNAAQRLNHQLCAAQTGGPDRPMHIHSARVLAEAVLQYLDEAERKETRK